MSNADKHLAKQADGLPHMAAHGAIGLVSQNCTVCMICVRDCPAWCISIEAHQEVDESKMISGRGRARMKNVLDQFQIDYGLCMYCGICIEQCPFEALHWVSEHHTGVSRASQLVAGMDQLGSGEL